MKRFNLVVVMVLGIFVTAAFGSECLPGGDLIHRGDVNCSGGEPNMTDVIQLSEFVNDWDPEFDPIPCCFEGADVNGDGFITNLDVISLLAYLYQGCGGCLASPHCPCSL